MDDIDIRDIPLTFVILDIINSSTGTNWYWIEQNVPLHPDFLDYEFSTKYVLNRLCNEGYVWVIPDQPSLIEYGLYDKGARLHDELMPKLVRPSVVMLNYDNRCWANPPKGPRFATWIKFTSGPREGDTYRIRGMFFEGKGKKWSTHARVTPIDDDPEIFISGATFDIISGGRPVGYGKVSQGPLDSPE